MKVNTIEEYLGTLQASTVEAWKAHLKTDKYSAHIALNEFYEDVVDLVDALIEEYQGIYGKIENLKNMMTTDKQSAIDYLESLREMTREGKSLFKEDELKSDIDSILSLIDSTLYKLKELKESNEHRGIRSLSDYLFERLAIDHPDNVDEAIQNEDIDEKVAEEVSDKLTEAIKGGTVDEGILGTLIGGIAGATIGATIMKAVCKALGLSEGPLYNVLTSR